MLQHQLRVGGVSGVAGHGAQSEELLRQACGVSHILYLIHETVIFYGLQQSFIYGDHILLHHIFRKSKRKPEKHPSFPFRIFHLLHPSFLYLFSVSL